MEMSASGPILVMKASSIPLRIACSGEAVGKLDDDVVPMM
jgi:hypothetical protein